MGKYDVITIGREFGSGGLDVGRELSKRLGYPLYDKEILDEAAKKSGFTKEIFEKHDEKPTNSFLYALAMGAGASYGGTFQRPLMLDIYLAQFETIKKLAADGPGIFIGRCADYVLNEHTSALHVFISCDRDIRIKRIMENTGLNEKKATELMIKSDKERSSYYNYYSNEIWGDSRHYDLCLNTGKFGIEGVASIIESCVK